MAQEIIVLSAGHRPGSPGAIALGKKEWQLTGEYVRELKAELEAIGITVVLVPQDWPLSKRQQWLREYKLKLPTVLAIEFHFNALNGKAVGAEAFTKPGDKLTFDKVSPWLALSSQRLGLVNRGMKLPSQSARGSLGWVSAGGCIWEISFMDNPKDMALVTPVHKWARGMAETLMESGVYINSGLKGGR